MNRLEDKPRWNDVFVKRPVVAVVLSLTLLLVGIRASVELSVIQFPVMESSALEINTYYPGASAETVRGFVTEPIERAVKSVPGVDFVESTTTSGSSLVTAWLRTNESSTDALAELSTRLSQIRFELPAGAEDPAVSVRRADKRYDSFHLAVTVPENSNVAEVTDLSQRELMPRLASIPNVQSVTIYGTEPAMRIWMDTMRMAALNVAASDIQAALFRNNIQSTIGRVKNSVQQIDVTANTDTRTAEDFASILIRRQDGVEIRLGDVARVEQGTREQLEISRLDQQEVVFIGVMPLPAANELEIADAIYAMLPDLNATLPEGMELKFPHDETNYMRDALKEIFITLGETVILVGLVVVLLMGSVRAASVPLMTIPISLLGTAAAMMIMGFTLNLLTVLAIVLSVGLVVDDAIVVVENVAKNLRDGMSRKEAALASSRRLLSPIIAMTVTLAVVYAPIGLLSGLTGFLFREFAFALAVAVLLSGVIAITLSPIMSAWVCPDSGHETFATRWVNGQFDRTARVYAAVVNWSLNYRAQILLAALFLSLLTLPLYMFSLKELAPTEDQGGLTIVVDAAPDSSVTNTLEGFRKVVGMMEEMPETDRVWQVVTTSGGFGGQELVPAEDRDRTAEEIFFEMYGRMKGIANVNAFPIQESALPTAGQFDVEMVFTSGDTPEEMLVYAQQLVSAAEESGLFMYADTDLRVDLVQGRLDIDRKRLADLGMNMDEVSSQLSMLLSEGYVTRYNDAGRARRVMPMVQNSERDTLEALLDTPIRAPNGDLIPLGAVATIERTTAPRALNRFEQKDSFKVFGAVIPGATKEQGLAYMEARARELLPNNYLMDYTGESRELRSEGNTLMGVLAISLILVFLVLAVQFNSFRDPLIILLGSTPLALFGALSITFVNLSTINIYSQVGLITLIGLVAKNAILIVEFANQAQREGLDKIEAIKSAAESRLRPVLMTTGATVLGHFPLVLVSGAGAAARNSIGYILVMGMLIGTFFTLLVLPAVYAAFASDHTGESVDEAEGVEASDPSEPPAVVVT